MARRVPPGGTSAPRPGYSVGRTESEHRDGAASAFIQGGSDAPLAFPLLSQSLPFTPADGDLRFEAWIRTRGVVDGQGGYAAIEYFDASGQRISFRNSEFVKGDSDWTRVVAAGGTPSGTARVRLVLLLRAHGSSWFDAVRLTRLDVPVEPAGEVTLRVSERVAPERFLGIGVQHNPFAFGPVNALGAEELGLIEARVAALRPRLVRMFLDTRWWAPGRDTTYTFDTPNFRALLADLRLYERVGAAINLVVWRPNDWRPTEFEVLTAEVADLLDRLQRREGLRRLRYLTLYNEPDSEFPYGRSEYARLYRTMRDALARRGVAIELIAGDVSASSRFYADAATDLADVVGQLSYHEYPQYASGVTASAETMRERLAAAGAKPVVIWEFNARDSGSAGTFTPGTTRSGTVVSDTYDAAMTVGEYALAALGAGIAGLSYWEVHDMRYPGDLLMRYGLWAYRDEGWRIRPAYYVVWALASLVQSGATVTAVAPASCDRRLAAAALVNPDGSRTLYVSNPWEREVMLRVTGLPAGWLPRRYIVTASAVTDLASRGALGLDAGDVAIGGGELRDRLPARSFLAYSDAH